MGRVRQLLRLRMQQTQNIGKGGLLGPAASIAAGRLPIILIIKYDFEPLISFGMSHDIWIP